MPYPDNMPDSVRFFDEARCEICHAKRDVEFVTDCGMTEFWNDDDRSCPECGGNME